MSHPAFFLKNGHLTYDASKPDLCTDHAEICYGVPVPTRRLGPTGGWGGGKTLNVEELPPSVFGVDAETRGFCTAITKKLLDSADSLKKNAPADPLSRPKGPGPDYALKEKIQALRDQVRGLQAALDDANRRTMLPWALFQQATTEIRRLAAAVAAGETELARLRNEVAAERHALEEARAELAALAASDPEAAVRYTYVPVPQLTMAQFEALHRDAAAGLFDDMGARTAPAAAGFPWAEAALAVGGYVAGAHAFPKSWKGAQAAAYAVSGAAALAALVKIIRSFLRAR